jgi:hypothetical protein
MSALTSEETLASLFDGRPILGIIPVRVLRTVVGDNIPGEGFAPVIPSRSHARALKRYANGQYLIAFDGFEFRVAADNLELLS